MPFWMLFLEEEERDKLLEIYNTYQRYMYVIAYTILRSKERAEDAVSESILKLSKHLDKVDQIEGYRTKGYIAIIVKNTALDMIRESKGRDVEFNEAYMEPQGDMTLQIERQEELSTVLAEIRRLPDRYRDVLLLRYVHELEDDVIAKQLCISRENVRKRVERGRRALLSALEKAGE
ncbi:MAG: sigma-70 family RNA polymerase sigma factor [Tissierellia bacterium]|nr:sigma-70 family RNA polymerase sigma factor [Tissierellia bacterium]